MKSVTNILFITILAIGIIVGLILPVGFDYHIFEEIFQTEKSQTIFSVIILFILLIGVGVFYYFKLHKRK